MRFTKEECIEALQDASEKLGHSVSKREYESLDINPSAYTIQERFDSWSKAKEKAGLEEKSPGRKGGNVDECPKILDLPEENWLELSSSARSMYKKKAKVSEIKKERGCDECGYDEHSSALVFHHTEPDNKTSEVSTMVVKHRSMDKIVNEIEKCIVLCSNCHKVLENDNLKY